ncbi:MAG: methyltransferase domain-containing protein [Actinomycetota bacterium]|nr:methyltransferase domain-containing protein [Actinomycetota bacterium]
MSERQVVARSVDLLAAFAWFIRDKSKLPSDTQGIVVDVGSGHSPHFRAHILIEKYLEGNQHRIGPFTRRSNRQLVFVASAERLPFKDNSVGFLIASHLLEHLEDPDVASQEFSRVAKAGYVECPSEWIERLFPFPSHLWYVKRQEQMLIFEAKKKARDRRIETTMLSQWPDNPHLRALFRDHTTWTERLVWEGAIDLKRIGEAEDPDPEGSTPHRPNPELIQALSRLTSRLLSLVIRPRRLKAHAIDEALCCPACHGALEMGDAGFTCEACRANYPRTGYVIDFLTG